MQIPLPPDAATESRNAASMMIDSLTALEIVELMNREDAGVATAVAAELRQIAAAVDVIADRFQSGGRLIYMGAGTSGRLGVLDASECPPTFSVPRGLVIGLIAGGQEALTSAVEGAEDRREQGEHDLRAVSMSSLDVVMGIATSGRTPYVLGGLEYARSAGAFTLGLSCNADSALQHHCRILINPVVGPEVITGSTRLKAGTATKMVLNMLTTGAMIRIGKTYENLMVDLTATNEKLRDRARRIVSELTGLTTVDAGRLLDTCQQQVKTAVLVHRLGLSFDAATERIQQCGGHLRTALGENRS